MSYRILSSKEPHMPVYFVNFDCSYSFIYSDDFQPAAFRLTTATTNKMRRRIKFKIRAVTQQGYTGI